MATMTLSIPDELKERMRAFSHVNWSAVARDAVTERLNDLERRRELRKQLDREEKELSWAVQLGDRLKRDRMK